MSRTGKWSFRIACSRIDNMSSFQNTYHGTLVGDMNAGTEMIRITSSSIRQKLCNLLHCSWKWSYTSIVTRISILRWIVIVFARRLCQFSFFLDNLQMTIWISEPSPSLGRLKHWQANWTRKIGEIPRTRPSFFSSWPAQFYRDTMHAFHEGYLNLAQISSRVSLVFYWH